MRYTFYTLLAATLLVSACKKTPTGPPDHFPFNNENDVAVNAVFYRTFEDYCNTSNSILSVRIQPHTIVEVPYKTLGDDPFFIDFYTDDYAYSNWSNYGWAIFQPITGVEVSWPVIQGRARTVLIENTGQQTRWKLVDVIDRNGVSQWGQYTESEKNIQLIVKRGFRVDLLMEHNSVLATHPYGGFIEPQVLTRDFKMTLIDTSRIKDQLPLGYYSGEIESTPSDDTLTLRKFGGHHVADYDHTFILVKQH